MDKDTLISIRLKKVEETCKYKLKLRRFNIVEDPIVRSHSSIFPCYWFCINSKTWMEAFVEISCGAGGFSVSDMRVFDISTPLFPGIVYSHLNTAIIDDDESMGAPSIIGLIYRKPNIYYSYEDFFNNQFVKKFVRLKPSGLRQVKINVRIMLNSFHNRGYLLPPFWDSDNRLFFTKKLEPVLLGSGSIIVPLDTKHFNKAKKYNDSIFAKFNNRSIWASY